MFTSIDNALTAMIMGALYIWNSFNPTHVLNLDPTAVSAVIGVLTPVLVYLVPNKASGA